MAEWQDQLNTILSDPNAMAQIAALAQSISGGQSEATPQAQPEQAPPPPQDKVTFEAAAQAAAGGLDPELMNRLAPLMQQLNRPESSQATALLQALRPFLSEKRRDKVERAAQLARLIHLGKTFFTAQGQEAGHV